MAVSVENLNFFAGAGTAALQVATVILAAALVYERWAGRATKIGVVAGQYGLHAVFLLSLAAAATSLIYSEVFGIAPCGLCWLQRALLYPQVIIAGIALVAGEARIIAKYLIGLSIPGAIIAFYQHLLQMGSSEFIPCPATGLAADCAERAVFELGYITFPLMSFTIFVFIIVAMIAVRVRTEPGERLV